MKQSFAQGQALPLRFMQSTPASALDGALAFYQR